MTLTYKRKCMRCNTFKFFKERWKSCLSCYEKRFGRYNEPDRKKYL